MGTTTNNLLEAGARAVEEGVVDVSEVRRLHAETVEALDVEAAVRSEVMEILDELERFLQGILIVGELSARSRDYIVSFGERLSTRIFAAYCRTQGMDGYQVDAFDYGMITDDEFTQAQVHDDTFDAMAAAFAAVPAGAVPIVTGFLGRGKESGAITTLGRGGSDLTATVIAAALRLREVNVWKDVDGLLTADPRIIPGAQPVPAVSFEEANELAFFGAKVLHPVSMKPVMARGIPVRVRNSYNVDALGTCIQTLDCSGRLTAWAVKSIVTKNEVTLIDLTSRRMVGQFGFMAKAFATFEAEGISVDTVSTSEVSISLTLNTALKDEPLERLCAKLEAAGFQVTHRSDVSLISIITNACRTAHIAAVIGDACSALSRESISVEMASIGASKLNVGLVVSSDQRVRAVKALHQTFFPVVQREQSLSVGSVSEVS
jgi:aspartate kinase